MKSKIPEYVINVLEKLNASGYESFLVGGAVRDLILGLSPKDYDITTKAKPDEILEVFSDFKSVTLGIDYGTIGVIVGGNMVEITTYRRDGEYSDGRHPDGVSFSDFLLEDLKRRDFTINAMAYGLEEGLIDEFGGIRDLNDKIIRVVGDGEKRFKEDYLRILRGVKFKTRYGFEIEGKTFKSMKDNIGGITSVSVERIREELFQILLSDSPSAGIRSLESLGGLKILLVELYDTIGFQQHNPNHDKDVYNHILSVVDLSEPKIHIRLSAFFHDLGKVKSFSLDEEGIGHFYGHEKVSAIMAEEILTRYKVPNSLKEIVLSFVENHMVVYDNISEKGIKRLINRIGKDYIYDFLNLQKADRLGTSSGRNIDDILDLEEKVYAILNRQEPLIKKDLAINGKDVIELGYEEGKNIGNILDYCLNLVLEKPEFNHIDTLKEIILEKFDI